MNKDEQYEQLALALEFDPSPAKIQHDQVKLYKKIIIELVSAITTADRWIKAGGDENTAMFSLTNKVQEIKKLTPEIYDE